MFIVLFWVGIVGLLGATFLFPVLGRGLWRLQRRTITPCSQPKNSRHVAILIPAHNEEAVIGQTIATILESVKVSQSVFPDTVFTVSVGADGCSDRTAEIVRALGVQLQKYDQQGKWATLNALLRDCGRSADWVVFADSGTVWSPTTLTNLLAEASDPAVVAVAPSYDNRLGGLAERTVWSIERLFKTLESHAGGPISIHGATVLYRATELRSVVSKLAGSNWLNDDVVIPLMLRSLYPHSAIRYLPGVRVSDQGAVRAASSARELGRRRRMARGNIQWIRGLLVQSWRSNIVAAVIALRRVFRLLWAYWVLCLAVAVLGILASTGANGVAAALVLMTGSLFAWAMSPVVRRVSDAATASLLAPMEVFRFRSAELLGWR